MKRVDRLVSKDTQKRKEEIMSKELSKTYDPKDLEDRLYKKWEDNGYFHAEVDRSKKPFTIVSFGS